MHPVVAVVVHNANRVRRKKETIMREKFLTTGQEVLERFRVPINVGTAMSPATIPMVETPVEVMPPAPVTIVPPGETRAPVRYTAPTDDKPAVKITFDEKFLNRDPADYNDFERAVMSWYCLLYTSPSPRDRQKSRMPSSA